VRLTFIWSFSEGYLMKVLNWGALAGALVLVAVTSPVAEVHAQTNVWRAFEDGRGARIGASVTSEDASDAKDAKPGVTIETVDPGGPADKASIKAGDVVTDFDGERVRSVRQFLRLVQETTPGRSVPVVLSRAGQRVTVNVTPERAAFADDFGFRYLATPRAIPAVPAPPSPPSPPRPPRMAPAAPLELFGLLGSGRRLGITIENLDTQLAEYFGVKEGVLVKSVAADSAGAKAGLKAGDVITAVNGRKVYDSSDVTRALDRTEDSGDVTIEITRDKKAQTLKGKLEVRDTRARTRIRTVL
jgi:serine protease Do